ncbi:MAG: DUF86 domain-containing protein [Chlorogloea purpurea SAG 13.99]|nr:DUF86 domain-containing protein [Chlorogloea purpurea SAG 13.99]
MHDYTGIDLNEVWNVIEKNLPVLKQEIIKIIVAEQNSN